jgi:nucleoside-specific outer membrane channel protein Tsx
MKKTLLAAGAVLALSTSFTAGAAENDKPVSVRLVAPECERGG